MTDTKYLIVIVVFLCNSPVVRTAQFSGQSVTQLDRSNIGTRLTGHVIWGLNLGPNLPSCGHLCVTITHCLSINFAFQSGLCELNSVNRSMVNSAFMEANGSFIYADFATLGKNHYICSSKPCSGTERCISLTHGVYKCETTDCGDPPSSFSGASLDPGSNTLGSIRTYTCPVDFDVDGINTEIVCNGMGWSLPEFTCLKHECPDPLPSLSGASISGGFRTNRSVRTYHCPDGQRTVGDAQITCNGFDWTTPSFTCNFVTDCTQLQLCDDSYTDGEYWLYPDAFGNVPVKIYCHNLDVTDADGYITVDPDVNYSYNRQQHQINDSRCHFTKIGISIGTNDVTVNADDLSFILRSGPFDSGMEYGKAIACACNLCPVGHFSINTTITGLIIDPSLVWKLEDFGAAMEEFLRSSDGDAISANCGGHCGGCGPEREMTLQINQKHVIDLTKATVPSCKHG